MISSDCVVVGHRGFKAKHTENTIHGFERCFETGATSIETDVWTTKDDILVISHDVSTKRIFCDEHGNETDYNILETNFEQLKPLRTIGSGEPLMTFKDVLRWYLSYTKEHAEPRYKIMLDLKNANPPKLLRLLFEDILEVHPDLAWWFPRIQIGLWNLRFVKYLNQDEYFQGLFKGAGQNEGYSCFDIYHISLSWQDSLLFLAYNEYLDMQKTRIKFKTAGVSLIHVTTWSEDFFEKFMPAVKKQNLKMYTWTVNSVGQLRYFCAIGKTWCLPEYGVITDVPDKMIEALDQGWWETSKPDETPLLGTEIPEGSKKLEIPTGFLVFAWIVKVLMYFSKPKEVLSNPDFESYVSPDEKAPVKRTLGHKIFALLQAWGIF